MDTGKGTEFLPESCIAFYCSESGRCVCVRGGDLGKPRAALLTTEVATGDWPVWSSCY